MSETSQYFLAQLGDATPEVEARLRLALLCVLLRPHRTQLANGLAQKGDGDGERVRLGAVAVTQWAVRTS